jgi:misacylated tRNA(Ala) deacylase
MAKDYDPRMHSAEHILNQTMVRMFDRGRSFSAHVEKKKSKCDYHFDRDLTPQEREELERRVNEVVAADLPVREEFMLTRDEAGRSFNLSRLPEGSRGNDPHHPHRRLRCLPLQRSNTWDSSGAIGGVRIISTGSLSGVLRIRFRLQG